MSEHSELLARLDRLDAKLDAVVSPLRPKWTTTKNAAQLFGGVAFRVLCDFAAARGIPKCRIGGFTSLETAALDAAITATGRIARRRVTELTDPDADYAANVVAFARRGRP